MRTIITVIALFMPCAASAQTYSELMQEVLAEKQGMFAPQPIVPVVPVYPVYPPNMIPPNQYGTGYSVVTTERVQPDYVQQFLGVKGAMAHTTVTSVVPNNAWGAPIRPPLFMGYP